MQTSTELANRPLSRATSVQSGSGSLPLACVATALTIAATAAIQACVSAAGHTSMASSELALPLVRFLAAVLIWSGALIGLAFVARPQPGFRFTDFVCGATLVLGFACTVIAYDVMQMGANISGGSSGNGVVIGMFGVLSGAVLCASALIALAIRWRGPR